MKHKKLHILYIITKLELGGAQKVCLVLAKELKKLGHEPLLLSGSQGALRKEAEHTCTTIFLDEFIREVHTHSFFKELKCFFKLIRKIKLLKKQYPDLIVHTHSTKAGILGRWAAWCAGIKKRIHTVHGYAFHKHQRLFMWLPIYFLECITSFITTHFICVSSEDVKIGIKLFPRFAYKHSIIRAAVAHEQFYIPAYKTTIKPNHQKTFVFGTVSCFKPQKNIRDMLHAFAYAHKKNNHARLEIIGDGIQRKYIEQYITDHNLQEKVILHGWQENVAPIMHTWHAFVLSSLWEGLPCAVIEARLLKLPVLAYNTGGIKDIIENGKNGFLYPQKKWQQLADGMLLLMNNQELYQKLSTFNDNLFQFHNEVMVQEHIQLYQQ